MLELPDTQNAMVLVKKEKQKKIMLRVFFLI